MIPKFKDFINEGRVSMNLGDRRWGSFTVSSSVDRAGFILQFIPDSKTLDMPKDIQIEGIKSNLERIFPDLYTAFEIYPDSPAAGIVFKLNTFAFVDYLTKEINRKS
jgi:hypothetical protein